MIGDFIVSLASYSKRIGTLHICLESIFSQILMPKKLFCILIILCSQAMFHLQSKYLLIKD